MAFESWIPGMYIRQGTPTFCKYGTSFGTRHNMRIASGRFVV
jgi:hypothetical protein